MQSETDTVVFLGPSLPVGEAEAILPARYEPPARRGSVYEVIASGVTTILLIDGVFHNQPSVWQREIDAALQAGISVFGCSSMGALRAAELHRFGMVGHGVVFDWYHTGVIDGDDEVALLHGEADTGYRAMSEPLVNIRYTLARARDAGVIPDASLGRIVELAKRVYYPERSFPRLFSDMRADVALAALADPLATYAAEHRVDIKRRDAISLLERVNERRPTGKVAIAASARMPEQEPWAPRDRHGHARIPDAWRRFGQSLRKLEHEGRRFTLGELWNLVQEGAEDRNVPNLGGAGCVAMSPSLRHQLLRDRGARALAVEYGHTRGLVPPRRYAEVVTARLHAAIAALSGDAGIARAPATERWRTACRMTHSELEERLAEEASAAWFADGLPAGVVDRTAGWSDPLSGVDLDPVDHVGLYWRVFSSSAERLACRRVALAAALEEYDDELRPVSPAAWSELLDRAARDVLVGTSTSAGQDLPPA